MECNGTVRSRQLTVSSIYAIILVHFCKNREFFAPLASHTSLYMMKRTRRSILVWFAAAVVGFAVVGVFPSGASAAETPLRATLQSQSIRSVLMEGGAETTVVVELRNTGTATWTSSGDQAVELNAESSGRPLSHPWWVGSDTSARLSPSRVKPGETGTFSFAIRASEAEGRYHESFTLYAGSSRVQMSPVRLHVKVGNPPLPYQADLLDTTCGRLYLEPTFALTCYATYQNTGTEDWGADVVRLETILPVARDSAYHHDYWRGENVLNVFLQDIAPEETVTIAFAIEAPSTVGRYLESFGLVANSETKVIGSSFDLPVKVYDKEGAVAFEPRADEPMMRVGIWESSDVELSSNTPFEVVDQNGAVMHTFQRTDRVHVVYDGGVYDIDADNWHKRTRSRLTFRGSNETIFTLENYENRPAWNTDLNDNQFRYQIDVVYSDASNAVWVVNALPLEMYMRGIAETSGGGPRQYYRSLAIAARTYALFNILHPTKFAGEPFILDATAASQVYRGYGYERRGQSFVDAVNATTGKVVLYDNEVAVTPYFSQSDGRTRSWDEVWAGDYPYLVSKSDPCCTNLELLGHGVGMSAEGALYFADLGWSTTKILKYYYSGVTIEEYY